MNRLRHIVARGMIHAALRLMPPGRIRQELTQMLWAWRLKVDATIAAHRDAARS